MNFRSKYYVDYASWEIFVHLDQDQALWQQTDVEAGGQMRAHILNCKQKVKRFNLK